jgi:predicted lipid-binding transport protein (Tim44 family)
MTPGRLVLFVALVGSAAVVVYGLFLDRTGSTIALTVAGMAVLGLTLAIIALRLAAASVNTAREGHGARSLFSALAGGLIALLASGSLGSAVILGLLARPV